MTRSITQVLWWARARGFFDHGLLLHAFSGKLWPTHVDYNESLGLDTEISGGTILVVPGRWIRPEDECGGMPHIRANVKRFPWYLFLHISDEEQAFYAAEFKTPKSKLWVQTPYPHKSVSPDRTLLLGWPGDTKDLLAGIEQKPLSERRLWYFSGQHTNAARYNCVEQLSKRPEGEGELNVTGGFCQGLPRSDYLRKLTASAIAPCPSGPMHADTFRLYEALEAGCLPIANRRGPEWPKDANYWTHTLGFEPFPCVDDWKEVHNLIDHYKTPPVELQRDANKALSWWLQYKRNVAVNLIEDVAALSKEPAFFGRVTVIMPTSVIPSHPSTEIIEDSIRRLRAYPELENAEVIITIDGLRREQSDRAADYEEYKRRLLFLCNNDPAFRGCLPVVFDEFSHQAKMLRRALEMVKTPLVMFVEHDTYPLGEIDFNGLFDSVDSDRKYIRLSIFDRTPPEHEQHYLGSIGLPNGIILRATTQYSARPHIANADWYRQVLADYVPANLTYFLEDFFLESGVLRDKGAMWQYEPNGDSILRSGTSDGRRGDRKFPI